MLSGTKRLFSFFVLSFPYSNIGVAQVLPGENVECACNALEQIFEYAKGAPTRIVFDNSTGAGCRACCGIRTAEVFTAFTAHYGFTFGFCIRIPGTRRATLRARSAS